MVVGEEGLDLGGGEPAVFRVLNAGVDGGRFVDGAGVEDAHQLVLWRGIATEKVGGADDELDLRLQPHLFVDLSMDGLGKAFALVDPAGDAFPTAGGIVLALCSPEEEVLAMMEDRLLVKRFRLVCMAKGDWDSTRTVSTMDDIVECPVCGSKMIAVLPPTDKEFTKIVAKRVAGKLLTKSEEKKYRAGGLMATLVSDYGKRALLVLAGRGIGATTAARILKPGLTDRHSLLREIAKAEKEYARTRPFWRD